jgi:integrase
MARRPKPWFRTETGWWMVTLGGKQHKLAEGKKNKSLAYDRFHEFSLLASAPAEASNARVAAVCEDFLNWSEKRQPAETCRGYRFYVQAFCEGCGYLQVEQLKPYHVTRWLDKKSWNETTQCNAIRAVIRVFNWAKKQGFVKENPLRGIERPRPKRRERCLTDQEYRKLFVGSHGEFRLFVYALRQTGARPSEVSRLTWPQVRDGRWILKEHKTAAKTGKPRVIYLPPPMVRLM